jgi:hypothetical protein
VAARPPARHPAVTASVAAPGPQPGRAITAYLVNQAAGTVIAIYMAANRPGKPVKAGCCSEGIAFTPDGRKVFAYSAARELLR